VRTPAADIDAAMPVVDLALGGTYRWPVDQASRNDIAAAAAAHRELGRDYDDAVAESLVERIGAEIDKRVEAKLSAGRRGSRAPVEPSRAATRQAMWTGAGIGAGVTGLVAMLANTNHSPTLVPWVVAVWVILAIAGLGTAAVRRYDIRRRE
jgi:hypothetical protein